MCEELAADRKAFFARRPPPAALPHATVLVPFALADRLIERRLRALQPGDVVLLEAARIGFGASGRNGGLIGSGQRKDVLETEALFGYERSRQLWDFAEEAKADIAGRIARHAIDCDLR